MKVLQYGFIIFDGTNYCAVIPHQHGTRCPFPFLALSCPRGYRTMLGYHFMTKGFNRNIVNIGGRKQETVDRSQVVLSICTNLMDTSASCARLYLYPRNLVPWLNPTNDIASTWAFPDVICRPAA
jgi:hypothetical protein